MNEIKLEHLVIETILTFYENAAELGCPQDKDVDMWFRELCDTAPIEVTEELASKIIDIIRCPKIIKNNFNFSITPV